MTMTDGVAVPTPETPTKPKAAKPKKKAKKSAKAKPAKAKKAKKSKSRTKSRKPAKRKKAANFTFKGPGGARERKRQGIHLLIIRVPVSVVKRIDAKLKKAGRKRDRGAWCAEQLTKASKR